MMHFKNIQRLEKNGTVLGWSSYCYQVLLLLSPEPPEALVQAPQYGHMPHVLILVVPNL